MAQQNIYPIQLLNDLHNYFPDILYNPGRFNSVQDLLDYIRRVADVNPFSRGMNLYNSRQTIRQTNSNSFTTSTQQIGRQSTVPIQSVSSSEPIYNRPIMPVTYHEPIRQTSNTRILPNSNVNNILNTLFTGFLGSDIPIIPLNVSEELRIFLDENVPVYPTNEQITNASRTYSATSRMIDICAICQDGIESEQQVRHLTQCNHYFHKNCIDTWFRQNVHCPTCRQDIREINNSTTTTSPPPVPPSYRRTNINTPEE